MTPCTPSSSARVAAARTSRCSTRADWTGSTRPTLAIIRGELAETLRTARSDRLYIRTSPDERVAVTVVGRSAAGPGLSDEDAVDLWREIGHPGAA